MAFELRDGQGTFFRNDKKPEGSQQPDYRGELMVGGTLHEIAGWVKEGQRGKWMSLSVKPKEARPAKGPNYDDSDRGDAGSIPF